MIHVFLWIAIGVNIGSSLFSIFLMHKRCKNWFKLGVISGYTIGRFPDHYHHFKDLDSYPEAKKVVDELESEVVWKAALSEEVAE